MFIRSINVESYKSIDSLGPIVLDRGANVIFGRNNAGKTSFLEALSFSFEDKPFKDAASDKPRQLRHSSATLEIEISSDDLLATLFTGDFPSLYVRTPILAGQASHEKRFDEFRQTLFSGTRTISLFLKREAKGANLTLIRDRTYLSLWPDYLDNGSGVINFRFIERGGQPDIALDNARGGTDIFEYMVPRIVGKIYRFHAERLNLSKSPRQVTSDLSGDASNLAGAFQQLGNNYQKQKILNHMKEIFPDVHGIATKNINEKDVEIRIWFADESSQRDHAQIPLSECGTGLSQALSILYVVVTSPRGRSIIIDEPNSFLHPGAAKKLINILMQYPQHQYVIATHSAEIIKAVNPQRVLRVTKTIGKTEIAGIELSDLKKMRSALADAGISMSDALGADMILWVEGKTEEECYRKLTAKWNDLPLGIAILGVINTGDLLQKKKHAKIVHEIYSKLSSNSNTLMPQAFGFIFDRENLSQQDVDDLERQSEGCFKFLPRRMFENYLLFPEAIAAALNELPTFQHKPITAEPIE